MEYGQGILKITINFVKCDIWGYVGNVSFKIYTNVKILFKNADGYSHQVSGGLVCSTGFGEGLGLTADSIYQPLNFDWGF